jgi:3-deoxy-D-manno-octulosonic-acid transferase
MKKSHILFFYVYRLLLAPVTIAIGLILLPFLPKLRGALSEKFKNSSPRTQNSIWIHAASGEFEYAKPLLPLLQKHNPATPLLVTYNSPSYVKAMQNTHEVDEVVALPLDLSGPMASFMSKAKPKMLLIARTDLWPEMLFQAYKRKIPTYVFAVTEKSKTRVWEKWFAPFKALLYNATSGIFCVSDDDKLELLRMGVTQPIWVVGDPRMDQALQRAQIPRADLLNLAPARVLTLTLGSTWPEDERVLWPALLPLLKQKRLRVLWAPHEPSEEHFWKLQSDFSNEGLSLKQYSDHPMLEAGEAIYVDRLGVLADLYRFSEIAFVGGSFRAKVHSVMEPLAQGNLTFFGPKNQNNREAQVFQQLESPLGKIARSIPDTSSAHGLLAWAAQVSSEDWVGQKKSIQSEIRSHQGASKRIFEMLKAKL